MKGVGFAGLGKALADNTLSLLKGRKPRSADPKLQDQRMSKENSTDYDRLMFWQREKRKQKKKNLVLFYMGIAAILVFSLILHFIL